MDFEIIANIQWIETIASGHSIHEIRRLNRFYGETNWRKRKGIARIKLSDGTIKMAELHWYEGPGIGRKELKIKKYLD
jgi:hypothetical protein